MKKFLLITMAVLLFGVLLLQNISIPSPSSSTDQVGALLSEVGLSLKVERCHGGWTERNMYCRLKIQQSELPRIIEGLGLGQSLPNFEGKQRIINVTTGEDPCSAKLRNEFASSFGIQQWNPTRHGFASAVLFFNPETSESCLFLSIAYG
jgi:hypothetical protein